MGSGAAPSASPSGRRWWVRAWCGWLAAVALAGCGNPLEVEPEVVRFEPPVVYRTWWQEVEGCVGIEDDFDGVRWFVGDMVRLDGRDAYGVWAAPNTIYLKRFYTTSAPAVKHEMLHQLTRGGLAHSAPAFTRCTVPGRSTIKVTGG